MRSHLYDCNFACASLFAGKLLSATPRDWLGEGMVPIFPHGAPLGAAYSCAVISGLLRCYCVFPAGGRIPACNEAHRKLLARRTAVCAACSRHIRSFTAVVLSRAAVQTYFRHNSDAPPCGLLVCSRHSDCVRLGGYQCTNHPCDAV